jgi:hypothetical protein
MAAAQLLLTPLCRAQNLRKDASSRTALNQEHPLSFSKAKAPVKLEKGKNIITYCSALSIVRARNLSNA